jgi:hypothetical protein
MSRYCSDKRTACGTSVMYHIVETEQNWDLISPFVFFQGQALM